MRLNARFSPATRLIYVMSPLIPAPPVARSSAMSLSKFLLNVTVQRLARFSRPRLDVPQQFVAKSGHILARDGQHGFALCHTCFEEVEQVSEYRQHVHARPSRV